MLTKPGILLRLEATVLFLLSLYLYHSTGAGWGRFFSLFLWPDLFILGYLANARVGATLYNTAHFVALPMALAAAALIRHWTWALPFALIWVAHIELDRALGFGLKYPTSFNDTHLQRV